MSELEIRNLEGKVVGKHKVSDALAKAEASKALIHRVVVAEEANARQGTQSAKTRSEVRGGGRKPYRQKKTGNARQGTVSAPHYTHGGMALAVKPRDYSKKVNRKERRAAILGALASKMAAGEVIVVESLVLAEGKTKVAAQFMKSLDLADGKNLLIILPEYDEATYRSFRNIPNVVVRTAPAKDGKSASFSTRDILVARKLVVAKDALQRVEEFWSK
jgi:large subunit ribosomal protein L4